jgi:hypothetical protein
MRALIAHGVYSWVPALARTQLLAAMARHLAPDGLAFISYATYPGAHLREIAREMTQYHGRAEGEPMLRVARAVEFVRFVRGTQEAGSAQRPGLCHGNSARSLAERGFSRRDPQDDRRLCRELLAGRLGAVAGMLLNVAARRLVTFLASPAQFATMASERPCASSLVRKPVAARS